MNAGNESLSESAVHAKISDMFNDGCSDDEILAFTENYSKDFMDVFEKIVAGWSWNRGHVSDEDFDRIYGIGRELGLTERSGYTPIHMIILDAAKESSAARLSIVKILRGRSDILFDLEGPTGDYNENTVLKSIVKCATGDADFHIAFEAAKLLDVGSMNKVIDAALFEDWHDFLAEVLMDESLDGIDPEFRGDIKRFLVAVRDTAEAALNILKDAEK
ncbi:MAG: hypothetical protein ABII07_04145 [Patescibacteria group bacterium]